MWKCTIHLILYLSRVLSDWIHLVDGDKNDQLLFRCLRHHFVSPEELRLQQTDRHTHTHAHTQSWFNDLNSISCKMQRNVCTEKTQGHIQFTDIHLSEVCVCVWCMSYLKYLFEQHYNIMCETIFADNFVVLCHSKANIRKVDGCSVEHLEVLVVQLLWEHTQIVIQTSDYSRNTSEKLENPTVGIHLEESNYCQFLWGLWLAKISDEVSRRPRPPLQPGQDGGRALRNLITIQDNNVYIFYFQYFTQTK